MTKIFEIKVRIRNQEVEAIRQRALDLGFRREKTTSDDDIYLVPRADADVEKIKTTGGETFFLSLVRKPPFGFIIREKSYPFSQEEKESFLKRRKVKRTLFKKREIYTNQEGIIFAFDKIKGFRGTFVEIQGEDLEEVKEVAAELGFKESDFIRKSYGELKR